MYIIDSGHENEWSIYLEALILQIHFLSMYFIDIL